MIFSTYALMPVGFLLATLTVATIEALGWLRGQVQQRRMVRLLAEMEE